MSCKMGSKILHISSTSAGEPALATGQIGTNDGEGRGISARNHDEFHPRRAKTLGPLTLQLGRVDSHQKTAPLRGPWSHDMSDVDGNQARPAAVQSEYMSVPELAELLRTSEGQIRNMVYRGQIPDPCIIQHGKGRRLLFSRRQVKKLLLTPTGRDPVQRPALKKRKAGELAEGADR
jgi:hypothetical protein